MNLGKSFIKLFNKIVGEHFFDFKDVTMKAEFVKGKWQNKLIFVVDLSIVPKEFTMMIDPMRHGEGIYVNKPFEHPFLAPDRGKMREFLQADENNSIPGVEFRYPHKIACNEGTSNFKCVCSGN